MNEKPLKIVSVETSKTSGSTKKIRKSQRETLQAQFEREWLNSPEKFNPLKNIQERKRLDRTLSLIRGIIDPKGKRIVDLGCGSGFFSRMMRDAGGVVDAVDISQNALKQLSTHDCTGITVKHEYMPKTLLEDNTYDIVIGTDLIAHLDESDFRIFFSELARIVKAEGYVVSSTPIDIHSENALQRFADLASTELDIVEWRFSYHYLYIKLCDYLKGPERFAKAWKDKLYRKKSIAKRFSLNRWWFTVNSSVALGWFWNIVQFVSRPILKFIENNSSVLLVLEKISRMLWNESAISHAIFIGKRRPILPPTIEDMQPKEMKHKKQVWE